MSAHSMLPLQLTTTELHPLFFRLFRCQDKGLRQMLFRHIVAGEPCLPSSESDNLCLHECWSK